MTSEMIKLSRKAVRRARVGEVEDTLSLAIGVASLLAVLFVLTLI